LRRQPAGADGSAIHLRAARDTAAPRAPGQPHRGAIRTRKLTGVILRCHDEPPAMAAREALRLIDSEPVFGCGVAGAGRWIAGYYCAPLGEVLRGMLPLASEIRRGKVWSLTDSGRDAARQLVLDSSPDDPVFEDPAHAGKASAFSRLSGQGAATRR